MVITVLAVFPSVSSNTVASSTIVFEGTLTDNGDGTFTGVIPCVFDGGFDIFAKEGANAQFGDDTGSGAVWTQQLIGTDHDAWPTWDPDTPDWFQYSLEFDGNRWSLRNHAGATEADPWYEDNGDGTDIARGVPMSGMMDWTNLYAVETDVGAYLPGTGTPEIPGGAEVQGGGAQAWDMDWSWGSEFVPLQYPGFDVTIANIGGSQYRVTLTPASGPYALDIKTDVTVADSGNTGNSPPIIKAKWEYVETDYDDDPFTDGLQVAPHLGGNVLVEYYAVVTDPEGVGQVSAVYGDVWHPDGEYKYQFSLSRIYATDLQGAANEWNYAVDHHNDLIEYLNEALYDSAEIEHELSQGLAYLYYGTAYLSYCQPAGDYCVGIQAHDSFGAWCEYLTNEFLYIPTSGIEIDFDTINYGNVPQDTGYSGNPKWIGGDTVWEDPLNKATVRNIGNTPAALYVWQDDMGFGKTGGVSDVKFDARLGPPNQAQDNHVVYWPEDMDDDYLGVRIPGTLGLCTMEKLDFSIHISKGFPNVDYGGEMALYAYIDGTPSWATPSQFIDPQDLDCPCSID